jgi:ketosteroid isomerase-like protein
MGEGNVEALSEAMASARERPDAFLDLLDEEVIWDLGDFPGGRFQGREQVREFIRQWIGAFEEWNFEVRECIGFGDAVFTHMHQRGRGKTSGVTTESDFWQVWLFSDGRIVRLTHKPDRESALEAAGIAE